MSVQTKEQIGYKPKSQKNEDAYKQERAEFQAKNQAKVSKPPKGKGI